MIKISDIKSKFSNEKINSFFAICNKSCKRLSDLAQKQIKKLAKLLIKLKISANLITFVGFVVGLLAINFLAVENYCAALLCILLNRICDILDGAVAKASKVTDFGIFLDATLDYIFYAGVIFGFALANPGQNAVAATFLLFAFAASACSLLAYAVIAYQNKLPSRPQVNESPFYLGGWAQGFETFVTLVVLCIVPKLFMPLAIILGIFCFIKAVSIIISSYYTLVIAEKKGKK